MIEIDRSVCDECGTCISVCPSDALVLTDYLRADPHRCTGCGGCINVCPFGALSRKAPESRS